MAWLYEHLPGQSAESLAAWLSEPTEIERFALIDVQRLDTEQIKALDANRWGVAVNLYGDLAGAAIAAQGPRLLRIPSDEILNMIQLALATQAVSFLIGKCDQSALFAHLQSIREVELPDHAAVLFRYQDIHVTSALFPVMPPADRGRCLGPLIAWGVLDACNTLHVIAATADKRAGGTLRFDQKTVELLDDSLFVHAAIAQSNDVDSALLAPYTECEAENLIRQRIEMARKLGLEQRDDLALYSVLSLQFPPGFEKEAPFAEALRFRERNKPSFGAAMDEVPSETWERWDERLKDKE